MLDFLIACIIIIILPTRTLHVYFFFFRFTFSIIFYNFLIIFLKSISVVFNKTRTFPSGLFNTRLELKPLFARFSSPARNAPIVSPIKAFLWLPFFLFYIIYIELCIYRTNLMAFFFGVFYTTLTNHICVYISRFNV